MGRADERILHRLRPYVKKWGDIYMKIKVTERSYEEVCNMKRPLHLKPRFQRIFWRKLIEKLSVKELKETNFSYTMNGMLKLGRLEPALILMNHSSFTDLQIVGKLFADRPYNIVCTNDGFVGKEFLMRAIGCIPTKKFIPEASLVKDMSFVLHTLHSSVVMYPEASYSFDGTQTPLPSSLGKCIKVLKVPVIMVKTEGAFLRDPLYNNLQKRKVNVSADVTYLLSPSDIAAKSAEEINSILSEAFTYDHFASQLNKGVKVTEPFRADGLHRVLYKCPHCLTEGKMLGKGIIIKCENCGETYELMEDGTLENITAGVNNSGASANVTAGASNGGASANVTTGASGAAHATRFTLITDWYRWERECVRKELLTGTYKLDAEVDILMLVDLKSMYRVGSGRLIHDNSGFTLTGCNGKLEYHQKPSASYGLYADYFWYEIGDMISIGDTKAQYYCFPKPSASVNVAKARLAAEELFKLSE